MKRFSILLLSLLCCGVALSAQEPDAVVLSHEESFVLQSPVSGRHTVKASILVNNKDGLEQAEVSIYGDAFESLVSFSGEIVTPSGGRRKVRQKDLETFSVSTGLVGDNQLSYYCPSESCPFTFTYEYTVQYKNGVIVFPSFMPVTAEKVRLEKASFSLDVPEGTQLISFTANAGAEQVATAKGRSVHTWQVEGFAPVVYEHAMPALTELVPVVMTAPVQFKYSGTEGRQGNWREYGSWLYSLQKDAGELPPALSTRLQELTRDCPDTVSKVRAVYQFLRDNTRYINISLGLGGLKPMTATQVYDTGYGDCKALSNYMQAMLRSLGIPSDYYIIHTDRANLYPGYSTVGQMNHAMLAVPLPERKDTLFLECTNPAYPMGYRHSDAAGHQVVLIKPEGGELVRIGRYPDSLGHTRLRTQVSLAPDGSANLHIQRNLYLDDAEAYIGFGNRSFEDQSRQLASSMKLFYKNLKINSVKDNFDAYDGPGYCPEVGVDYSLETNVYATAGGDRLFVPLNPISRGLYFQKSARVNDLVLRGGFNLDDTIEVTLPEGYSIESLPEDLVLETDWGRFESRCYAGDGVVTVRQRLQLHPFRADKSRYGAYKDFAKKVNKAMDAKFVLKK